MSGIERERREHRTHALAEIVLQEFPNLRSVIAGIENFDLLASQQRTQHVIPAARDFVQHGLGSGAHHRQTLARREAVRCDYFVPGSPLACQRGHTHHEKLVEIVRRNGQKLDAFEQRVRLRACLGEHAVIEGEPTQLPVNVERGIRKIGVVDHADSFITLV